MQRALDLSVIENLMEAFSPGPPKAQPWLDESYSNPAEFWSQLMATSAALHGGRARSVALAKYDFFFDLLSRHGRDKQHALLWLESNGERRGIRFGELRDASVVRAMTWSRQDVVPGQCIAIVENHPLEVAISVLAALRLGLVFSLIPATGAELVRRRIESLEPDVLDVGSQFMPLVGDSEVVVVKRRIEGSLGEPDLESHQYRSGDIVAKLFDPSTAEFCVPKPVRCDSLYLGALRDGVLALGLRPGASYCAPGFSLLDTQPSLWFSGWLWGATFFDVDLRVVEQHPSLLKEMSVQSVGVSVKLRDLILRRGLNVDGLWQSWWRCPSQGSGTSGWQDFFAHAGVDSAWMNNLRWQPAHGGCVLFSARRRGYPLPGVWPSAGAPWELMNPSAPEQPSVHDHGLFKLQDMSEEPETATANLLVKGRSEHLFGKVVDTAHAGYHYPVELITEALAGVDSCDAVSILLMPAHGQSETLRVVLLAFTDPAEQTTEVELAAALRRRIVGQFGLEYLPDRIEFFSHAPQRDEAGLPNHRWCARQYLAGALHRKSEHPIYTLVSELRRRCTP